MPRKRRKASRSARESCLCKVVTAVIRVAHLLTTIVQRWLSPSA